MSREARRSYMLGGKHIGNREAQRPMFEHPRVVSARQTLRWTGGTKIEKIYVIDTDLPLDEGDPRFDRTAFDQFMQALSAYIEDNISRFGSVEVRQVESN